MAALSSRHRVAADKAPASNFGKFQNPGCFLGFTWPLIRMLDEHFDTHMTLLLILEIHQKCTESYYINYI
jgi:hypothetical protein